MVTSCPPLVFAFSMQSGRPDPTSAFSYCHFRTMGADKWATSKVAQLSTKVWVKLLLLLENALKLNFEAL